MTAREKASPHQRRADERKPMSTSDITPDRNEAERFLAALDPGTDQFTFQTFDDDKARRERRKKGKQPDPFAKVLHGTLSEHWKTLASLNAKGAGIFVTINETDGKGRRTNNNIIRVRAVFADLDGAPLEPVLANGALKPTIITETSPGHFHVYWCVKKPASEAEAKAVLKKFGGVQKAIAARYGGDPSVHDLARVMRLPGFIIARANRSFRTPPPSTKPSLATPLKSFHHQSMTTSHHGPNRCHRARTTTCRSVGNF
jgi:hypothetical protein